MTRRRIIGYLMTGIPVLIILGYFLPLFKNVSTGEISEVFKDDGSFLEAFIRSLLFASSTSFLIVFFSLVTSILCVNIQPGERISYWMSVWMLPVLIGNVAVAFCWKLQLFDNSFFFESKGRKFIALFLIQLWQYGTLFSFIFWLNLKSLSKNLLDYTGAIKLSKKEIIRDVYLPKSKNLSVLLFIILFISSFYEDAKIQFIFRASRGTHTELVNQWFTRTYQSNSLINTNLAFKTIATPSIFMVVTLLIVLFIFSLLVKLIMSLPSRFGKNSFRRNSTGGKQLSKSIIIIICICILYPILRTVTGHFYLSTEIFGHLSATMAYTFFASIVATLIAVLFAIGMRMIWRGFLHSFQLKTLLLLLFLFSLLLVPSITLLALGYERSSQIGYSSIQSTYMIWLAGQCLLAFPLLAGFSIVTHFKVRNTDLDYFSTHRIPLFNSIKDVFVVPFSGDYLLTFIIAFSLIWNEPVINNILSDFIPSFVSEIQQSIVGKSGNYATGTAYFLVALALGITSVLLWNAILKKSVKINAAANENY